MIMAHQLLIPFPFPTTLQLMCVSKDGIISAARTMNTLISWLHTYVHTRLVCGTPSRNKQRQTGSTYVGALCVVPTTAILPRSRKSAPTHPLTKEEGKTMCVVIPTAWAVPVVSLD